MYDIRAEAKEFPLMCVLSFVYICNAECPNCPYTNSEIRADYKDAPIMKDDTFKLIADQCGEYGSWIRVSGGGEPMMHPRAVPLFEYAKKAGARIGLITNGSLFDIESLNRLLKANVDMIEFSVDASDPATYAKVRKGLDWENLVGTVKKAVQMRNALGSATKIIASGINQEGVDIEKVEKYWEGTVDEFQKRKYLTWNINDPGRSADPEPYLPPEERIPCPFIFERLNIDSRGKVMVCGYDIAARTDMGNIHERSIKDIWRGEGFERYRQMHLARKGDLVEPCNICPDWKYRSWKHNYWKIVKTAEETRKAKVGALDFQDSEGCVSDNKPGKGKA